MSRVKEIDGFLEQVGWSEAERRPLPGDASTRRYVRLVHGPNTAMLLDQPQGAETSACPPDADEATRLKLGYNAVARLAGPDTRQFAAVAAELNARGLSAPKVLAADYGKGLLLTEDLGDARFADIIRDGEPEAPLYAAAVQVLAELHRKTAPATMANAPGVTANLLRYDRLALLTEVELLPEWFFPVAGGIECPPDAREAYRAAWAQTLTGLSPLPPVLTLRDYHAENLMWLPDRHGVGRVGLLDFQDALAGSPAYDLVSLLEDARRDVAPQLADAMTAHYVDLRRANEPGFDEAALRQDAAILAAQRNAKIIGIFARLWRRDGKPRYLSFLPRMWGYMQRDLAHPALRELRIWFDAQVPQDWRGAVEPK
jgi:N-acetylmuramate 1-kinase